MGHHPYKLLPTSNNTFITKDITLFEAKPNQNNENINKNNAWMEWKSWH